MMAPEIEFVIKQCRNHPSLVLWAGDNECDFAFSWAGTRRDPNHNVITRKLIPDLLRIHDFTRPYLPSSPYMDEHAYKSGEPISEDHLWGPRDYFKGDYYKNTVCHFASETGYHGCPSPKSLEKFMTKETLWPIFDENGIPGKEILHGRGLLQGDPLSSLLFDLAMDLLPRILEVATQAGLLKPLPGRFIKSRISLYADDDVIFLAPEATDIANLKALLQNFGDVTGLMPNVEKSSWLPFGVTTSISQASLRASRHAHPVPHQVPWSSTLA
jgi:hypothetical protein